MRGEVDEEDGKVYDVVETRPSFPGGESALLSIISKNVRYPEDAQRDSIQGRVVLQFVVNKDGKVSSPKVIRGVCKSLDEEAVRLAMLIPDFVPGKMNGKPVAVRYTLPILFKLTRDKSKSHSEKRGFNVNDAIKDGVTVMVDGKKVDSIEGIDSNEIASIDVLKDNPDYPEGLIRITTKKGASEKAEGVK